jgi:PBSX family phage portal protein
MAKKREHIIGMNVRLLQSFITKADNEAGTSKAKDPFETMYDADGVVRPLYTPLSLCQMPETNTTLKTCIDAMCTNVDGFGFELVERTREETDQPTDDEEPAKAERRELASILMFVNPDEDVTTLRTRLRKDIESAGYGMLEVVDDQEGKPRELYLLPAHSMRITKADTEWTEFEQPVRGPDGKFTPQKRRKRFRRYVQVLDGNNKVYFKEFWDHREINSKTGKPMNEVEQGAVAAGAEGAPMPANRVLFFNVPCPYSIYGLPRWIPCVLGIMGSYKADEINLLFFDNKSIPPMVVTVSGGHLTEGTLQRLKETFEHQIKGVKNFHKCLVIEAIPEGVGEGLEGEKVPPVRIEFKPLTTFIQDDALFRQYGKDVDDEIRSAFRLPPIYVGRSEEYTRATALESARVAEQQVFEPERRRFDYQFNRTLMAAWEINYFDFASLGTKTVDDAAIVEAMSKVKEALTIGDMMEAVAEMRGVQAGDIPEEFYVIPLALAHTLSGTVKPGDDDDKTDGEPDANDLPPEDQDRLEKSIRFLADVRQSLINRINDVTIAK